MRCAVHCAAVRLTPWHHADRQPCSPFWGPVLLAAVCLSVCLSSSCSSPSESPPPPASPILPASPQLLSGMRWQTALMADHLCNYQTQREQHTQLMKGLSLLNAPHLGPLVPPHSLGMELEYKWGPQTMALPVIRMTIIIQKTVIIIIMHVKVIWCVFNFNGRGTSGWGFLGCFSLFYVGDRHLAFSTHLTAHIPHRAFDLAWSPTQSK